MPARTRSSKRGGEEESEPQAEAVGMHKQATDISEDDHDDARLSAPSSTRGSSSEKKKKGGQSKRKAELRKKISGVGLKISLDDVPKGKKIMFGDDGREEEEDNEGQDEDVEDKVKKADESDDDAIEEVQSGAAKADIIRQRKAERKSATSQAQDKKKRKRKPKVEKEDQVAESSEDEEGDESEGSVADELDEEFFAMVDSGRQAALRLNKLRKKSEKMRKLQKEKKIGRHTNFVSDDGDHMGKGGITDPIRSEHGIDVVVLPSAGGMDDSDDEGGMLDMSSAMGVTPSKTAVLFARGSLICGDVARKGKKKQKGKPHKGRKDQGWKRSRKATHLSVARGSRIGAPAANFVKRK